MSGATFAAAVQRHAPLIVTFTPGAQTGSGTGGNFTFVPQTAHLVNGVGPYTYAWNWDDPGGVAESWGGSGQGTTIFTPSVVLVPLHSTVGSGLILTVTDAGTGKTGVSPTGAFQYTRA